MRAVNLIPAEQREGISVGAGRSGGAAYAVMALIAGIALLAFLVGLANHQISSRRSQIATVTAQGQRAQAQAGQLASYTTFATLREQRMKAVTDLVDSRFDWAHVIHEFGRVLPVQVSVTSLTGTIAGGPGAAGSSTGSGAAASSAPASSAASSSSSSSSSSASGSSSSGSSASGSSGSESSGASAATVTSATPPGSVPQFTLTGCATSQPAVALMLDRLRLIDGVSSVTLQSSTKTESASGASAASNSGGAGGCTNGQPAYAVQVAFEALPSSAQTESATKAVSARGSISGSTTSHGGSR